MCMPLSTNYTELVIFILLMGSFCGCAAVLFCCVVGDFIGVRRLPLAFGVLGTVNGGFYFTKPFFFGHFRDVVQSYDGMFRITGAMTTFTGENLHIFPHDPFDRELALAPGRGSELRERVSERTRFQLRCGWRFSCREPGRKGMRRKMRSQKHLMTDARTPRLPPKNRRSRGSRRRLLRMTGWSETFRTTLTNLRTVHYHQHYNRHKTTDDFSCINYT